MSFGYLVQRAMGRPQDDSIPGSQFYSTKGHLFFSHSFIMDIKVLFLSLLYNGFKSVLLPSKRVWFCQNNRHRGLLGSGIQLSHVTFQIWIVSQLIISLKMKRISIIYWQSASLTMLKPWIVWITTNCGQFFKRWEYQTTLLPFLESCMQVKKQHFEPDMEKQIGSKLEKEYVKAVYCHPAYLTSMQSTSCKMPGCMNHRLLELRLPEDTQMIPF